MAEHRSAPSYPSASRAGFYLESCQSALRYAESNDYRGYNKHDALNSPLLAAATLNNRWLRLLATQVVTRAPINLRPFLGVRKTMNAKGIALFARAYLTLQGVQMETPWLDKARTCLDRLAAASLHEEGYSGHCWGYPYDWQDIGFFAPTGMPNCVVTCFVGRAFVHGYEVTGEDSHLEVARSACDFLLRDLTVLHDSPEMLCLSYAPVPMHWVVMDTSALAGALVAAVARHTGEKALHRQARRLIAYVADKQTDYGAWYYSHPPGDSHITHDNYHTGFILDAIRDYADATGDSDFGSAYRRGLEFYAERLFLPNGAPKWMHNRTFPHDIHGAAQGIITFSKAACDSREYGALAERIARWTLSNLYCPTEGRFYYQKGRYWTKRFTLLRWCNGWMARALSSLLRNFEDPT